MDSKVEDMKSICQHKDAQIQELRSRLNRATISSDKMPETDTTRQNILVLTKAIKERDEQIEKLQDQMKDASK